MRALGLDIGDRRIGVALCDPEGILASAFTVISRVGERRDIQAILDLVDQNQVERIVVGLPRSLDGSIGIQANKVQSFARKLAEHTPVPVDMWDERLSTVAADRAMVAAGIKPSKRKMRRDAVAAAFILQGYLDRMRHSGP